MTYNDGAKWGRKPDQRKALVAYIIQTFGTVVSRKQLLSLISGGKCEYNELTWIFVNKEFKAQRGQYNLASMIVTETEIAPESPSVHIDFEQVAVA